MCYVAACDEWLNLIAFLDLNPACNVNSRLCCVILLLLRCLECLWRYELLQLEYDCLQVCCHGHVGSYVVLMMHCSVLSWNDGCSCLLLFFLLCFDLLHDWMLWPTADLFYTTAWHWWMLTLIWWMTCLKLMWWLLNC